MNRLLPASLLLALCFLLAPHVALAQSAEDLERFEELVAEGQVQFDQGEYSRAIDVLQQAERIFAHPTLSVRILQAAVAMGNCTLAGQRLTRMQEGSLPPALQERLPRLADEVESCEPRGRVLVECSPETAALTVQGEMRTCGEAFELPAGSAQGSLTAEGYERTTIAIAVREAETTSLRVALEPLPPPAAELFLREGPAQPIGIGVAIVGVGLMGAGIWVDRDSADRQFRLQRARRDNEAELIAELEEEERVKRRQSFAFFASGATLTGAGLALFLLGRQFSTPAGELSLQAAPDGFSVELTF